MANDFKVTVKGKELELSVRQPTRAEQNEGEKVYRRAFKEGLNNGDILRIKLDEHLREQNLWDDTKQAEYDTLQSEIQEAERTLSKGGIKLSEARDVAINLRKKRFELVKLSRIRSSIDDVTCEAQADNARFNFLISACTVYKDNGKPYFKDYEALLRGKDDEVIQVAGSELMKMFWKIDENTEADFAENKFLKKFNFIDSELRLINKDGKLIDTEGRLIDENGFYIDEAGNRVDRDGHPLTQDGEWKVDEQPFLDDNGDPIVEATKTDEQAAE